jgi:hypothetical protein
VFKRLLSRLRKSGGWGGRLGAVATFAIALLGAVTGLISFERSNETRLFVRATGPYVAPSGVWRGPSNDTDVRTIPVSVVNNSDRSVVLIGGQLLFDNKTLGSITGVTDTSPASASQSAPVVRPVPTPIGSGGTLGTAVSWKITNYKLALRLRDMRVDAYVNPEHSKLTSSLRQYIKVQLAFEPGGTHTLSVDAAAPTGFPYTSSTPKYFTFGGTAAAMFLIGPDLRVHGFLAVDLAPPNSTMHTPAPGILSVKVWSPATGTVAARTESPILGTGALKKGEDVFSEDQALPFGYGYAILLLRRSLPNGEYAFALFKDGRVSETGAFALPCPAFNTNRGLKREVPTIRKLAPKRLIPSDACLTEGTTETESMASYVKP